MLTKSQLHKLDMLVSKAMMRQPLASDHWPNLTHEHYMEYVELEHISYIIRQLSRALP